MWIRVAAAAIAFATIVTACTSSPSPSATTTRLPAPDPAAAYDFPAAPQVLEGPIDPALAERLISPGTSVLNGVLDTGAVDDIAATGDARLAWYLADLLRFFQFGQEQELLIEAFVRVTGVDPSVDPAFGLSPWKSITDHLFVWDLPAFPGYREAKARVFVQVEPGWRAFFDDADADIDWRVVSWGGVFIDDRPAGSTEPCPRGCIPALDDPALTDAAGGGWFPDDGTVFGVVVGDEAVALPKNVMEVHEMVNVTIGGRRLGIPYCTLCGSAQAYLTDSVPAGVEVPVLRTSGLLTRSNKVMYDLVTSSVFDTFTGRAVSGPLREAGIVLEQVTVVTSSWGAWKQTHPGTRIVAEDGGIGASYPSDPLGGRDDDGPIFPIGEADGRLPVQTQVVGVITPDGTPVAFPADEARAALADGVAVGSNGVVLVTDGGGLRVETEAGDPVVSHQAFWFAWSQFHPSTEVWRRG